MNLRILVIFIIIQLSLVSDLIGQTASVDSFVVAQMHRLHLPGLEWVAVDSGKIVQSGYLGYQSLEKRIPVSSATLFEVASTSKVITAAAILKLEEQGKLSLDEDVNKYLDFRLFNPHHPGKRITVRQLLRHRSSVDDNVDYLGPFWSVNNGDPKISLTDLIQSYFSPAGKHYSTEKNFYSYAPGQQANYSNMGIALLGYIAERVSGVSFDKYCKQYLFLPLEMSGTGWFLRDIDSARLAMPYRFVDSLNTYLAYGFGGFPDYPAGSLHTNAEQLAHFLIAWTQHGIWNGRRVFEASTIQKLTPDDINLGFHTWSLYGTIKGELLYYHTGRANGVSSFISYNPARKRGLIFVCNGEIDSGKEWRLLIDTLYSRLLR